MDTNALKTPPTITSRGPASSWSLPMDDPDSAGTRKRPRLDSGESARRSMSADTHEHASPVRHNRQTEIDAPRASKSPTSGPPDPPFSPTKVTINVREPQSVNITQISGQENSTLARETTSLSSPPMTGPTTPEHGSNRSSPAIEVAEVEDVGQEPSITRWRPLKDDLVNARNVQSALLDTFPDSSLQKSSSPLFSEIKFALERREANCEALLENLAQWIERYLVATQDFARHWWDLLTDERDFWEELPSIMDTLLRQLEYSKVSSPLLHLSSNGNDSQKLDPLARLLGAWMALALRMTEIDLQTLADTATEANDPDLISDRFVMPLQFLTKLDAPPWKHLAASMNYNSTPAVAFMMSTLCQGRISGLSLLTRLVMDILDRPSSLPALLSKLLPHFWLIVHMSASLSELASCEPSPIWERAEPQIRDCFSAVNTRLQAMIVKQTSGLSFNICHSLMSGLTTIFEAQSQAEDLCDQDVKFPVGVEEDNISLEEKNDLIFLNWRLETFKKCIVEGRMEIRVQGVDGMQHDLVRFHRRYIEHRTRGSETPVALFLAKYLIDNKIVSYLLSAESHAQLISRSGNILGFLVVTGKLTDDDIDLIWSALISGQQSRSSEVIIHMLTTCVDLCSSETLLQLIDRLGPIPIERFDAQIRHLTSRILNTVVGRLQPKHDGKELEPSIGPFNLCLRMVQNSVPNPPGVVENRRPLHEWALGHLTSLMRSVSNARIQEAVFSKCLKSIAGFDDLATGSISALSRLLMDPYLPNIRQFAHDHKIVDILVADLQHLVGKSRDEQSTNPVVQECLLYRLNLMTYLIPTMQVSKDDLARSLTDLLLGASAIDDIARDAAWNAVNRIAANSKNPIAFIDFCITDCVQNLPPQFVVPGCLDFIEVVRDYLLQTSTNRPPDESFTGPTPAELLWQMSLTIPIDKVNMAKRAIDMLIRVYLDSPDAHRRSREDNDTIHVESVERCIAQLKTAAHKLRAYGQAMSDDTDDSSIVVIGGEEVEVQRLYYTRSLMILKGFVHGVRSRPMYSPSPELPTKLPKSFDELSGDPITIKYQAFSEGKAPGTINTFQIGGSQTIQQLRARLSILTGYSRFMIIANGKKVNLDDCADDELQSVHFLRKGLLLVRKISSSEAASNASWTASLRPMETEVLRHFEDLYSLLNMEDGLAQPVFDFLIEFPPHADNIQDYPVHGPNSDESKPGTAPYKTLYTVYVLKTLLHRHQQNKSLSPVFLTNAIAALVPAMCCITPDQVLRYQGANSLMIGSVADCLGIFLRASRDLRSVGDSKNSVSTPSHTQPMLPEENVVSSIDIKQTVDYCVSILSIAPESRRSLSTDRVVYGAFYALLEGAMVSIEWSHVLYRHNRLASIIASLLLEDSRVDSRLAILKVIKGIKDPSTAFHTAEQDEFIMALINACFACVQQAPQFPQYTQQLFDAVLYLLGVLKPTSQNQFDLESLTRIWIDLMVHHQHYESFGRSEIDYLVLGLARLAVWSIKLAKSSGRAFHLGPEPVIAILATQLFPDLGDCERLPQLFTKTRSELYTLLLHLVDDDLNVTRQLLQSLKQIDTSASDASQAWTWGIASVPYDDPTLTEPNWNLERFKVLRSPVGYSGLRNLSNTCYMNSILTQLFMNIAFREFILNVSITDDRGSQRLLNEIRSLFAYMQHSALKAIDTEHVADSIITYDNTAVDVTHQVDVDEFYNLLFDRLESQILIDSDRKVFRSFYGGQLVQQIKSKECSHISERLEPFSAIQCDIVGKSNLLESLNAYVQGESMDGDNKYSCTSCGSYVDANKRACFKDLPNDLIFHLKRFDYDMLSGTRTKVNDRFEFPKEIDMTPYSVDYLSDPTRTHEPDIFSLVGVLVHSGTAESGHYYSYIQERTNHSRQDGQWVEFNDMDVSEFSVGDIDGQCYGGWQDLPAYETRYQKVYNAYMLFYERVQRPPVILELSEKADPSPRRQAILPLDLKQRIDMDNQIFLRQFCHHDSAHTAFINNLLQQVQRKHPTDSSANHDIELATLELGLEHIRTVLSRVKETVTFDDTLQSLKRLTEHCNDCSTFTLQWASENEHALHDLLLRCPQLRIREEFAKSMALNISQLRDRDVANEELSMPRDDIPQSRSLRGRSEVYLNALSKLLDRMRAFWNTIYLYSRGWDEYFGLLAKIVTLGPYEAHLVLKMGFLQCCFELLDCEHMGGRQLKTLQPYQSYLRMVEKGRKFSLTNVVGLVAALFDKVDLSEVTLATCEERPFSMKDMPLTEREHLLIHANGNGTKICCVFLEKPLSLNANSQATDKIIRAMLSYNPMEGFPRMLYGTIKNGIGSDPANLAGPFLQAALVFCENTPVLTLPGRIIHDVAAEISTIGLSGGREHLDFLAKARRLRNMQDGASPDMFHISVMNNVHLWAPYLVTYWDADVREGTMNLLKLLLFRNDLETMDDEELADAVLANGKRLCEHCASHCQRVLHEGKSIGRTTEEITTVIRTCLRLYFSKEEDDMFISQAIDIVDRLQALAVTDLDDQVSAEWPNGSDLPSDSDSDAFGVSP